MVEWILPKKKLINDANSASFNSKKRKKNSKFKRFQLELDTNFLIAFSIYPKIQMSFINIQQSASSHRLLSNRKKWLDRSEIKQRGKVREKKNENEQVDKSGR